MKKMCGNCFMAFIDSPFIFGQNEIEQPLSANVMRTHETPPILIIFDCFRNSVSSIMVPLLVCETKITRNIIPSVINNTLQKVILIEIGGN